MAVLFNYSVTFYLLYALGSEEKPTIVRGSADAIEGLKNVDNGTQDAYDF